jgi:hypothetical protein
MFLYSVFLSYEVDSLFPLRAGFTKFTEFQDYVVCGKQTRYVSHYKSNPENQENPLNPLPSSLFPDLCNKSYL